MSLLPPCPANISPAPLPFPASHATLSSRARAQVLVRPPCPPVWPSARTLVRRTHALFVRSLAANTGLLVCSSLEPFVRTRVIRSLICSWPARPNTCLLSARPPDDLFFFHARPVQFSLALSLADLLLVLSDCVAWLLWTCSAWLCYFGLARTRTGAPDLLLGLLWASDLLCCCCCWICCEHWMKSKCYISPQVLNSDLLVTRLPGLPYARVSDSLALVSCTHRRLLSGLLLILILVVRRAESGVPLVEISLNCRGACSNRENFWC